MSSPAARMACTTGGARLYTVSAPAAAFLGREFLLMIGRAFLFMIGREFLFMIDRALLFMIDREFLYFFK